jgi:hypothetical protein
MGLAALGVRGSGYPVRTGIAATLSRPADL